MKTIMLSMALAAACGAPGASAAETLHVAIGGAMAGSRLNPANASCIAETADTVAPGLNRSLALSWSKGPDGTRSYAVTMVDVDVPADLSLLDKAGTVIEKDAPRMEFAHWVLADIPASIQSLAEGADGDGQPRGGLPLERTPHGLRGQNGFAAFLKDGPHGGYLGPCPPWNDRRVHRYRVTVTALDVETLGLSGVFTRADLVRAAEHHRLASGTAEIRYSVSPSAEP